MVITTRGGPTRVLEYDRNYGQINEMESGHRINLLFMLSSVFLIILLQSLIIVSFNYDQNQLILIASKTPSPMYRTHMVSVTKDGAVYVSPPVIQNKHSQLMSFEKHDWEKKRSLKNLTGFQLVYEYQDLVYYMYGQYENTFSTLRIPNYSKYKHEYFVEEQDQNHFYISYAPYVDTHIYYAPYQLPNNVSWVNVGEYIWFYGNEVQRPVSYTHLRAHRD